VPRPIARRFLMRPLRLPLRDAFAEPLHRPRPLADISAHRVSRRHTVRFICSFGRLSRSESIPPPSPLKPPFSSTKTSTRPLWALCAVAGAFPLLFFPAAAHLAEAHGRRASLFAEPSFLSIRQLVRWSTIRWCRFGLPPGKSILRRGRRMRHLDLVFTTISRPFARARILAILAGVG